MEQNLSRVMIISCWISMVLLIDELCTDVFNNRYEHQNKSTITQQIYIFKVQTSINKLIQ